MRRRLTTLAAILSIMTLASTHAFAQDTSAARALARDAKDAFDAGEWAKARDLYHRAGELLAAPTLTLREARCLAKLGKLVDASELMVKVTRWPVDDTSPAAFRGAIQEAASELAEIRKRLPSLKLSVAEDQAAELRLDDAPVARALLNVERPVDPGVHTISGIIAGKPILTQRIHVAEAAHLEVVVQPADAPGSATAPPSTGTSSPASSPTAKNEARSDGVRSSGSTQSVLGWAALGAGVVGVGVGVATGLVATSKHSDLESTCPNNLCPSRAQSDLDSFRSMRTISTVGYVVGGVGIAGGAILLLTSQRSVVATASKVTPWVGLGAAGLRGAF